ncbi:MAG: hypothetical protein QXS85_03670 [Acidilobaceae archaeon]
MRVVVVVHDYVTDMAAREVARLRELLASITRTEVTICALSELRDSSCSISEKDLVYPLLLLRGRGYSEVLSVASTRGARVISLLSLEDIVEALSRELVGCSSVLLVHAEAGRSKALNDIARELGEKLKAFVEVSRDCSSVADCIVVASLLPGSTTLRSLERCGDRVVIPYLLPLLENTIVERLKRYTEASSDL